MFQFHTGLLVDNAHRQADFAPIVNFEDLDLHFLHFGKDIADFLNALIPDFRDVDKAVLAAHEIHESAEINEVDDLAVVDLANFRFLDNAKHPEIGRAHVITPVIKTNLVYYLPLDKKTT